MKKIILAFDGVHFSEGAFAFARKLNELQPVLLTGIFLPQAAFANLWSYAEGVGGPFVPIMENNESEIVQQNIDRFEKLCQGNGIEYRVHKDFYDFVIPEIRKESNYADMLILGSEVFYEDRHENVLNDYLREALQDVRCPVLVGPEKFEFPESIILAYDGSEESVFAIKQFAYLLPELTNQRTLLVYANENPDDDFPDKIQMEELVSRHFGNLTLFRINMDARKYFSTWVSEKKSALLVSGSYGRSGLSQLFKKSFVRDIIVQHQLPVFIAHK